MAGTRREDPLSGVPGRAAAVVIGGGIVGSSLAHHLVRLGWAEVVLLDKGRFPRPGGSTGHASNFLFPVDHSKEMTRFTRESIRQYRELGVFTECGGIEVARTEERLEELRRRMASATAWGEPAEPVDPLALVDDHDHSVARRCDDLLTQERTAASLDEVQRADFHLVRAIDRHVDAAMLGEAAEPDPEPARLRGRPLGGRDRDHVKAIGDARGQGLDGDGRGRAAAEAEHHPILYLRDGRRSREALQVVLLGLGGAAHGVDPCVWLVLMDVQQRPPGSAR